MTHKCIFHESSLIRVTTVFLFHGTEKKHDSSMVHSKLIANDLLALVPPWKEKIKKDKKG